MLRQLTQLLWLKVYNVFAVCDPVIFPKHFFCHVVNPSINQACSELYWEYITKFKIYF